MGISASTRCPATPGKLSNLHICLLKVLSSESSDKQLASKYMLKEDLDVLSCKAFENHAWHTYHSVGFQSDDQFEENKCR